LYDLTDYNKVESHLEDKTPAYILVRTDERTSGMEYNWLLLCYVPDDAKVRDKMLYASTKATLTKELGDSKFSDSIYGTKKVSLSTQQSNILIWNGCGFLLYRQNSPTMDTRSIWRTKMLMLL
jgi:hypothetical protein